MSIKQWKQIKIGLKESNLTWRTYSQGNRSIDIVNNDYRIILFDSGNKEIIQIKKVNSKELAKIEIVTIGNKLGLNLYWVFHWSKI